MKVIKQTKNIKHYKSLYIKKEKKTKDKIIRDIWILFEKKKKKKERKKLEKKNNIMKD